MAKHENRYDTGTCNNFKKHKFVKFEYQKIYCLIVVQHSPCLFRVNPWGRLTLGSTSGS